MVVLLGFPDVEVSKEHTVEWWSNKIGGLPNWFNSVQVDNYPCCCLCGQKLYHLVQVYCPLDNSRYHRTLNIFGCTNKKCWNHPESIVALRSQQLDVPPEPEQKTALSTDDWGADSAWCDDDDDWGTSADAHVYEECASVLTESEVEADVVSDQLDHLTIADSSNKIVNHTLHLGVGSFTEYHLYVQEECVQRLVGSNDYEMKLYEEYVKREGVVRMGSDDDEEQEGAKKKGRNKSKGDGGEKYEKTKSKSNDAAFHQFKKTIAPYPGQLLRYNWCGEPLLLSSRSPIQPSISPPNCPYCQSKRVFELQLMPSLLNYLHHHDNLNNTTNHGNNTTITVEDTRLEFGCVYVFSCSTACWDGSSVRSEYVAVQPDPDVDVLK